MSTPPPDLPGFPSDSEGPVFQEPWEAKAFAMVLELHERGLFTWTEWAEALAHEIRAAQSAGDADSGDTYYQHWLRTLESMVARVVYQGRHGRLNRDIAHAGVFDFMSVTIVTCARTISAA